MMRNRALPVVIATRPRADSSRPWPSTRAVWRGPLAGLRGRGLCRTALVLALVVLPSRAETVAGWRMDRARLRACDTLGEQIRRLPFDAERDWGTVLAARVERDLAFDHWVRGLSAVCASLDAEDGAFAVLVAPAWVEVAQALRGIYESLPLPDDPPVAWAPPLDLSAEPYAVAVGWVAAAENPAAASDDWPDADTDDIAATRAAAAVAAQRELLRLAGRLKFNTRMRLAEFLDSQPGLSAALLAAVGAASDPVFVPLPAPGFYAEVEISTFQLASLVAQLAPPDAAGDLRVDPYEIARINLIERIRGTAYVAAPPTKPKPPRRCKGDVSSHSPVTQTYLPGPIWSWAAALPLAINAAAERMSADPVAGIAALLNAEIRICGDEFQIHLGPVSP